MKFPKGVLQLSILGTGVGAVVLLKEYMGGTQFKKDVRIPGRTVIVTGANTGIGKETARELARRGGRVILACRDMAKAEKARQEIIQDTFNKNVYVKKLDLASLKSIREFADDIVENEKRLDILINNAGVMRTPHIHTEDGFEMQIGVNHFGPFLLTNLLLDKLQKCAPSRIINVSSIAHVRGHINFEDLNSSKEYYKGPAYEQSKLANVLFSQELAEKLKGTGVTVYTVHPGIVRTELTRHMGMENSFLSRIILGPIFWLLMKTSMQGAQTTVYCALDPDIANESGLYYSDCRVHEVAPQAKNIETQKRLWAISERWTHLPNHHKPHHIHNHSSNIAPVVQEPSK